MTAVTAERGTIPVWRVVRAAWFRNRLALIGLLVVFAAGAAWTLYQAMSMRSYLVAHQVLGCTADPLTSRCEASTAWQEFTDHLQLYQVVFPLFVLPIVVAMFGGVRWLTREYETGTFRYTWTQGVSRLRWLAGTAAPLLVVTIVGAIACGLAFDRWIPMAQWLLGSTGAPWGWSDFPFSPLAFAALVIAGFGIAVLAAAVIRRTLPAMATTLAVGAALVYFADVRLRPWLIGLHPVVARAQYSPPVVSMVDSVYKGAYILSGSFTDGAGHIVPGLSITADGALDMTSSVASTPMAKVLMNDSFTSARQWLAAHHYTYWISYQPQDRLMLFHAIWAGGLLVVGVAALGIALWRVAASR